MFSKAKPLVSIAFLLAVCLTFGGCSSDDDNSVGPDQQQTATVPSIIEGIDAPIDNLSNSGNAYCSVAASMIMTIEGYAGFMQPATSGNPTTSTADSSVWSWTQGSMTVSMVYKETVTAYYWYVVVDGYDPDVGVTYDNFIMIEAEESKLSVSGSLSVYGPDGSVVFEWTWTQTGSTFEVVMTMYGESETYVVEVTLNGDGSGSCWASTDGVTEWGITWNSTGTSGDWYDDQGGSGTW